jgi:uncharacterized membrane protein YphA (DoxX/SURF4 family)/peroxiredoxin
MINLVLPLIRIVLVVVFAASGVAKLADLPGTRRSLGEFGVPGPLVRSAAIALPVLELLVAAALAATRTAQAAAAAALVLLSVFTAAISYQLARGRRPRCNCFGAMSGEAVGRASLGRNMALIAASVVVLTAHAARSGADIGRALAAATAAERMSVAIGSVTLTGLAFMGFGLVKVYRQQQRLLAAVESLQPRPGPVTIHPAATPMPAAGTTQMPAAGAGRPAPAFRLPDLTGAATSLADLTNGERTTLLLFIDPQCGPCHAALDSVSSWTRQHPGAAALAVISQGTAADNQRTMAAHGLQPILLQNDREVAAAYGVNGTPCMVAIGPDGHSVGLPAYGQDQIMAMLSQVTSEAAGLQPLSLPVTGARFGGLQDQPRLRGRRLPPVPRPARGLAAAESGDNRSR